MTFPTGFVFWDECHVFVGLELGLRIGVKAKVEIFKDLVKFVLSRVQGEPFFNEFLLRDMDNILNIVVNYIACKFI